MPVTNDLVFLSYAREDEKSASKLYKELIEAEFKTWFDQESLAPGVSWRPTITKAIRQSRYFIALLSSRSVSKKGFVQSELRQALEVLDEYPENETYLIPARLDPCEAPHDKLKDLQWVDFFPDWDKGAEKLFRFLGVMNKKSESKSKQKVGEPGRGGIFAPTVRLDGIYQSKKIGDFDSYVRFYADGLVIRTSTNMSPDKMIKWFNRETVASKNRPQGTYTISGAKIKFATTSSAGVVDLEGEIQGDNIILRSHYHVNGYRGVYEYAFIQLDALSRPEL